MVDKSEDTSDKAPDKSDKKSNKKKQPSILILFKVRDVDQWAVYPRLFNDEESGMNKLQQTYPFEDAKAVTLDI